MSPKIVIVMGTRPEAIKLFPVINLMKTTPDVAPTVCVTAQHRGMLDQILSFAGIVPDYDLDLMQAGQSLDDLSSRLILKVGAVLDEVRPDRVVVQGDTTTAMMAALAAFYRRIPVSHIEAGLRSGDINAPWPEEANRKIVALLADQHFAPTQRAANALLREGVEHQRVHITGNTVIDALLQARAKIAIDPGGSLARHDVEARAAGRRIVLVTCHRRESFGTGIVHVVQAIRDIAGRGDIHIVMPVHPNPNVERVIRHYLADHPRISLLPPLDYIDFVAILDSAHLILTDSGGVQEEAPALGKPVLVLRSNTERPEAVEAGTARLVGTDRESIVSETERLLNDPDHYRSMATAHNPFGDGSASRKILGVLLHDQRIQNRQCSRSRLYRSSDSGSHREPRNESSRRRHQS